MMRCDAIEDSQGDVRELAEERKKSRGEREREKKESGKVPGVT